MSDQELTDLANEVAYIGAALHSTNALRGRELERIAHRIHVISRRPELNASGEPVAPKTSPQHWMGPMQEVKSPAKETSPQQTRRQIVFNWLMEDDLGDAGRWWGTEDGVAEIDRLLLMLDAEGNAAHEAKADAAPSAREVLEARLDEAGWWHDQAMGMSHEASDHLCSTYWDPECKRVADIERQLEGLKIQIPSQ